MIPQSQSKAWLSNNTNVNWKHKNVGLAKILFFSFSHRMNFQTRSQHIRVLPKISGLCGKDKFLQIWNRVNDTVWRREISLPRWTTLHRGIFKNFRKMNEWYSLIFLKWFYYVINFPLTSSYVTFLFERPLSRQAMTSNDLEGKS